MATTNGNYQIVLSTRLDTNKIAQDLKKLEKISITVKISDDTIKRVRELNQLLRDTKTLQNFTQGMSNVSKSMQNYEKIASKVVTATANMAKSAEQVGNASQKASKHVKTFGERASDAFQKFSLWSVVSSIFYQIVNSAKQLVDTAIELDRSFTELTKVTNLTRDNFDDLTEKAII